ncbi:MAG: hypothetical protein P8Z70_08215 [Desulfuromonadales bacterium]|jgi:hypothetical protein
MTFFRDRNLDGKFTITDLLLNLKDIFFVPGNAAVKHLIGTRVGNFFEFSRADYGGVFAGTTSAIVWGFSFLVIIGLIMRVNLWMDNRRQAIRRKLAENQRKPKN